MSSGIIQLNATNLREISGIGEPIWTAPEGRVIEKIWFDDESKLHARLDNGDEVTIDLGY